MSFTYRENQNTPLTWAQLDGNFREVESVQRDVLDQVEVAKGAAESSAASSSSSQSSAELAEEMARISVVRWCGNSTTPPTTRLDGSPLEISDEYGNLSDNLRYNWTGTAWVALNSSAQYLEQRLSSSDGAGIVVFDPSASYPSNSIGRSLQDLPEVVVDAADRAEAAADLALALSGIYVDTAAGLAATTPGKVFGVPVANDPTAVILYANVSGAAVDTGARLPSTAAITEKNIWFDPFGEFLSERPALGFGTSSSYAGTLNLVSANTPYVGKPTLSTSGAGNVQRKTPLAALGKKVGDQIRFLAEFQVSASGGKLSIYFRDTANSVISSFSYLATPSGGLKVVVSDVLTIPATTDYIELRCSTGGSGTLELFAIAAGGGAGMPRVGYSPTPLEYRNLAMTQKNLWPDPLLRQHQAGIKFQDGWGYAQLAGQSIPAVVVASNNSPFPTKNVIRLPTGAGQHDINIDARRLGLRVGMKVTVSLVIYSAQSINLAVFGRDAAGAIVGNPANVSYTWTTAGVREIRKTIIVDQVMLDSVKFFQVRLLNGQTVGATPIEICARGIFVGDTAPILFDDCYADDVQAIERARRQAFGESTLRETQKRLTAITFGSAITTQFKSAHIGDSYTHLPARWMQPFATHMQGKYGDGGPGWIGLGNPDAGSGNINGQNWQGLSVTVTGTWTSAYATAPGPDICSVSSANVANQYRVNNLPAGLSALQLYALASAAILEYTTDGGATWIEVDLSVGSGATVANLTIPATGFNLWMRPKTGTCTLYGIDAQKAIGHRVHKLGATGSSAAQWATQTATAAWKASMTALDPNLVSIMLATNDQTGSIAPWVVGGYIETIIANVRLALPLADIAVLMPAENQRSNNVKMAAYASVVRELCARLNVAFCDLQQDYGIDPADYASSSARNWYSPDLIHPNPATDGGLPIAARMVKMLSGGLS